MNSSQVKQLSIFMVLADIMQQRHHQTYLELVISFGCSIQYSYF